MSLRNQEICLFFISGASLCAIVFHGLSQLAAISNDMVSSFGGNFRYSLAESPFFSGRKWDIADYEWQFWLSFLPSLLVCLFVHTALVYLIDLLQLNAIFRVTVVLLWDVAAVCWFYGPYLPACLIIAHLVTHVFLRTFRAIPHIATCLRLALLLLLLGLHYVTMENTKAYLSPYYHVVDRYAVYYGAFVLMALVVLRETDSFSYAGQHHVDMRELLCSTGYLFYMPVFYTGPIISYQKYRTRFLSQRPQNAAQRENRSLFRVLLRVALSFLALQLMLHYFYVWSLQGEADRLSAKVRFTLLNAQNLMFTFKYRVLYGVACVFCESDAMHDSIRLPASRFLWWPAILWREFDVGLYRFMTSNIYQPLRVANNVFGRLFALASSFAFVYLFHGLTDSIGAWSLINFLEVSVEPLFLRLADWIRGHCRILIVHQLLTAALRVPLFWLTAFSMYFFFNGYERGSHFLLSCLQDSEGLLFGSEFLFVCLVFAESYRWLRDHKHHD